MDPVLPTVPTAQMVFELVLLYAGQPGDWIDPADACSDNPCRPNATLRSRSGWEDTPPGKGVSVRVLTLGSFCQSSSVHEKCSTLLFGSASKATVPPYMF